MIFEPLWRTLAALDRQRPTLRGHGKAAVQRLGRFFA
jgi:hypothetical protein